MELARMVAKLGPEDIPTMSLDLGPLSINAPRNTENCALFFKEPSLTADVEIKFNRPNETDSLSLARDFLHQLSSPQSRAVKTIRLLEFRLSCQEYQAPDCPHDYGISVILGIHRSIVTSASSTQAIRRISIRNLRHCESNCKQNKSHSWSRRDSGIDSRIWL